MAQEGTGELVLHFEIEDEHADMQAINDAIKADLARVEGVQGVSSEVLGADRFIDPLTVGATIVTVTVAVKETTALVNALEELVESMKKLGVTLGVKAWMENRRKRVDIDADADSRAVAETVAANVQASSS
jgi:hypothetical protein